jgi:hypothetical protein
MFPQQGLSAAERRLVRLYRSLNTTDRDTLLSFCSFLAQRSDEALTAPSTAESHPTEPIPIERPAGESVIAAIKRLRNVYPMLERGDLLHEASSLMSAHVLQGRPAVDVIDDLEALFARHYAALRGAQFGPQGD